MDAAGLGPAARRGELMNVVLWVLQVLLAAVFAAHGCPGNTARPSSRSSCS